MGCARTAWGSSRQRQIQAEQQAHAPRRRPPVSQPARGPQQAVKNRAVRCAVAGRTVCSALPSTRVARHAGKGRGWLHIVGPADCGGRAEVVAGALQLAAIPVMAGGYIAPECLYSTFTTTWCANEAASGGGLLESPGQVRLAPPPKGRPKVQPGDQRAFRKSIHATSVTYNHTHG